MKCSKCGAELSEDTKFCSYCGQKVEAQEPSKPQESSVPSSTVSSYTYGEESVKQTDGNVASSVADKIKEKGSSFWNKRSLYGKITTVALIAFALFGGVAFLFGKTVAAVIAILQIIITVVAILMHKGVIKVDPKQAKLKYVLLAVAVFLTIPNVMSFSTGNGNGDVHSLNSGIEHNIPAQKDDANDPTKVEEERPIHTITKDTQYAYMSDEWNVYIATAVSDSIVKVEHWDKTLASDKKMEYSSDVATYKINDSTSGFEWIDDEHTAFYLTVQDKDNSRLKKPKSVVFTINTSDSDVNKGTNCDDKIIHYVYTNDDWHAYKAIPLTENLIKIEAWCRTSSLDKLLYGYDVCLIDLEKNETDFEWGGDDHKAFTITMQDPENDSYWKEESLVGFTAEEGEYEFSTVYEYLDSKIVDEDEAAAPQSASDYKFGNYKDAESDLKAAGFTEISYEILYDIVLGWTQEGEVDSISINGNADFEKGDVFKKNAPVVITYHMKEEDDPNKPTESIPESTETPDTTTEEPDTSKPLFYSTNDYETAKEGNTGVFAYRDRGSSYDIYWIIDFDEGYVYYFTDGNGESSCDRLKIESGTLNDKIIITYHDGGDTWSYGLHFKYVNHPETLIMNDQNGFDWEYSTTGLSDALNLRASKTIKDY